MKHLPGKVAVVTGAGSGMGRALAQRLAAAGCHLALTDVHAGPLEETTALAGAAAAAAGLQSRCPVLLVKTGSVAELDNVLVALNIAAKDEPHQRLNDTVITYSQAVARLSGAKLHAVNAFQGSQNFVHPPDLAKRVGVERAQAHVGDASPEELITRVAEKVGATLVIIGSLSRRGMSGLVVGNTAERILDNVNADVLTVFESP